MKTSSSNVRIDVPLLNAIEKIGVAVARKFPGINNWPEPIGLQEIIRPSKLRNGGYDSTPLNSLAFAWTGTEGQHFSFFVQNSRVDANSPIILTVPDNYWAENIIVAKDLQTFVRLALRYGCFELTELAYDPPNAICMFTAEGESPHAKKNEYYELKKEIRTFVLNELELSSYYYTVDEFERLQHVYKPKLEMSPEYMRDKEMSEKV